MDENEIEREFQVQSWRLTTIKTTDSQGDRKTGPVGRTETGDTLTVIACNNQWRGYDCLHHEGVRKAT